MILLNVIMAFSEKLKSEVRRKAHFACCLCKGMGVEVHHIISEAEGGLDTEDNAAPLCPTCHETYGGNPQKRKFIRETRDFWYEICDKRYASDADRIEELKKILENTVSYDDFIALKEELIGLFTGATEMPRSIEEIIHEIDVFFDKIWYGRHQVLAEKIENGKRINHEIWVRAKLAAKEVEKRYGKEELGPWDDFEWGMLNGKLSALRWVMGDDWDMLDT